MLQDRGVAGKSRVGIASKILFKTSNRNRFIVLSAKLHITKIRLKKEAGILIIVDAGLPFCDSLWISLNKVGMGVFLCILKPALLSNSRRSCSADRIRLH